MHKLGFVLEVERLDDLVKKTKVWRENLLPHEMNVLHRCTKVWM